MKYDPLSRRAFLQGLGGITLSIPFMNSLIPDKVWAATARRTRFVFMGSYFGRDIDYWYPKTDPTLVSPDGAVYYQPLSAYQGNFSYTIGSAFAPVMAKMNVLRGLDGLNIDNAHQWSMPLTASGTLNGAPSFGYSIDAILEESTTFTPSTMPLGALRTSAHNVTESLPFSYTTKTGTTQPLATQWDPQAVFDQYFNPATAAARAQAAGRKVSVSNAVMGDFKKVMSSSSIASADKQRLDNYMTLLTSLEARLPATAGTCASMTSLSVGTTSDTLQSAMIDLEVAALACGLTNTVVHGIRQWSSTIIQDETALHAASHQNGATMAVEDPTASEHAYYNRWIMTKVAEMLTKLDAVDDGGGYTLLDNTFFLYGIPDSRGFHTFYDMGVIVAGGAGKLKTGYYMDFRPRPLNVVNGANEMIAGRPYNNLLTTFLQGMGFQPADYQKFGQAGFGTYSGFDQAMASWYQPYINQPNATLPFLYAG